MTPRQAVVNAGIQIFNSKIPNVVVRFSMISIHHIHYDIVTATIYIEISMKNLSSLNQTVQISFFPWRAKFVNNHRVKGWKKASLMKDVKIQWWTFEVRRSAKLVGSFMQVKSLKLPRHMIVMKLKTLFFPLGMTFCVFS